MKRLFLVSAVALALAGPARAGGPFMLVGAADDVVRTSDPALAKAKLDLLSLAGLDSIRVTTVWVPGRRAPTAEEEATLTALAQASRLTGVRVIVTVMHAGSRTTPRTDEQQGDFAAYAASVVRALPSVRDFVVGNEPNLNRFWLPQYDPLDGHDVAAEEYVRLLARTWDAIKAVRPRTTVYGGALAPRGVDRPGTGRDTHSPTTFIRDMGAAYRASGRLLPIMDALSIHPYPENSSIGPDFPHPNSTSIGIADYGKLVALLGEAFDGTAQRGSKLPILYGEFGIESLVPEEKSALYTGNEPTTTKPVDEAVQAASYRRAIELTFCQPTVLGMLLFHVVDESQLPAWQSGLYYADSTPKSSLGPVRRAADETHRGIVTRCEDLALTPTLTAVYPAANRLHDRSFRMRLTCSIDCAFTVRLERLPQGRPVVVRSGKGVGRVTSTVTFATRSRLRPGTYRFAVQASATVNTGPPAVTASKPLLVRS